MNSPCCDGMGRDGTGRDGMGRDGMGWDGMAKVLGGYGDVDHEDRMRMGKATWE